MIRLCTRTLLEIIRRASSSSQSLPGCTGPPITLFLYLRDKLNNMQVANKSGIRMGSGIAINTTVDAGATHEVLNLESPYETVRKLGSCNAVVVFSMSGCCMCTVAKRLLFGLGVGPTIIELDEHPAGHDIQAVLYDLCPDGQQSIPAIFIGGKFLGGIETLMAFHINGSLVPLLKGAGALWL